MKVSSFMTWNAFSLSLSLSLSLGIIFVALLSLLEKHEVRIKRFFIGFFINTTAIIVSNINSLSL